jgi:hypothetical protein
VRGSEETTLRRAIEVGSTGGLAEAGGMGPETFPGEMNGLVVAVMSYERRGGGGRQSPEERARRRTQCCALGWAVINDGLQGTVSLTQRERGIMQRVTSCAET